MDSRLCFPFRAEGVAVGTLTINADDVLGCDEPGVLHKVRRDFGNRFRAVEVQEKLLVRPGMEMRQDNDFPVKLPQESSADSPRPIPTSSGLWASLRRPLSMDGLRMYQCKVGDSRLLATVSRPGICARLALPEPRMKSFQSTTRSKLRRGGNKQQF